AAHAAAAANETALPRRRRAARGGARRRVLAGARAAASRDGGGRTAEAATRSTAQVEQVEVEAREQPAGGTRAALALAALGVVFGDIGTSPLYAVKETFSPARGIPLSHESILGGLSTIFWALVIVVSLKYVVLVMRAHNRGEGGTIALLALASSAVRDRPQLRLVVTLLGLLGTALFFGETVLTPAISVLSAIEGLSVGTPVFDRWVLPITVVVLVGLFSIQRLGTAKVGSLF